MNSLATLVPMWADRSLGSSGLEPVLGLMVIVVAICTGLLAADSLRAPKPALQRVRVSVEPANRRRFPARVRMKPAHRSIQSHR